MTKADRTKARILDAALAEFSARGVAGARVDRIAAGAGCNKNLLYIYFGSKENLFAAVLETHLARLYEDVPFTPEDLSGFGGRVFDWAMVHPDLMRLVAWSTLEQAGQDPASRSASHDEKIDALRETFAATRTESPFAPDFLVTTVLAIATAWSSALPFGSAMHPDQSPPLAELRDQVVAAIQFLTACDVTAA